MGLWATSPSSPRSPTQNVAHPWLEILPDLKDATPVGIRIARMHGPLFSRRMTRALTQAEVVDGAAFGAAHTFPTSGETYAAFSSQAMRNPTIDLAPVS